MYTVAFDLDDTLYDRSQPLKKAFFEFIRNDSISFHQFHRVFQMNSEIAFNKVKTSIFSLKESHIYRIKETLLNFGVDISKEEALNFQRLYEENQQHISLYPFILDILEFLQERDVQTIIITNGPVNHQRNKIKNLGLDHFFNPEQIIVSGEVGIVKPDREIFKLVESRFIIDRKKTWYIGDSYPNDIIGATNAGWQAIWLNTNQESWKEDLASYTVSSTLELKHLLLELIK